MVALINHLLTYLLTYTGETNRLDLAFLSVVMGGL